MYLDENSYLNAAIKNDTLDAKLHMEEELIPLRPTLNKHLIKDEKKEMEALRLSKDFSFTECNKENL